MNTYQEARSITMDAALEIRQVLEKYDVKISVVNRRFGVFAEYVEDDGDKKIISVTGASISDGPEHRQY